MTRTGATECEVKVFDLASDSCTLSADGSSAEAVFDQGVPTTKSAGITPTLKLFNGSNEVENALFDPLAILVNPTG